MTSPMADTARPERADVLASAVRKIKWRVLPLFVVMSVVAAGVVFFSRMSPREGLPASAH
ncbi:hypothetical protein BH160DRAFT_4801 [Burkholderia sp. H160]|nr:hypothetical protein BH160DRAFT_4801 [Burkholderia sp. H160]